MDDDDESNEVRLVFSGNTGTRPYDQEFERDKRM